MADAEARRLERLCQARQQVANILKLPRNEHWDVRSAIVLGRQTEGEVGVIYHITY